MARSPSISVCNIALSEVRASPVIGVDDDTPESRACAIHYDECLQTLLEAHDWTFARKRVSLALLSTNDRPDEWLYAYAAPSDMSASSRLVSGGQSPISGVYYPWPYLWPRPPYYLDRWVLEGSTIYTNIQSAIFEYVSRDVEEGLMPATFKRALALDLASRLAITLLNDRALKGDLIQQAEAAKRRAMADDLNAFPRRDRPAPDEVALVRS